MIDRLALDIKKTVSVTQIYGNSRNLANRYGLFVSQMTTYMFRLS